MSYREEQRIRRERARRRDSRVRAERVAAVGSLIVVAVIVGVIVLTSGTGSGSRPSRATAARSASNTARAGSVSRPAAARPGTAPVPILVYHVINTQPAQSTAPSALYVPTDEFSSQMQALKANGWHAVTLDQVEAYWTRGVPLGTGAPIVITFDNGYASQYTNALPILKGLGWVGVLNLQLSGLPPSEGGLTDAQIRGLIAAGWEIDTEGVSHTDLTALDPAQLSNEIGVARQTLRTRYGVPLNWFSYPSGDYNAIVIAAVSAAGYLGATTINPGWARPHQGRFRLPRLVVVAGTTPSQLLAQIAAAKATTSVPPSYSGQGLA
jgi:peptidoglycan/xylan/chitin deacetylase (PgdA/CDA1 family)